MKKVQKKLGNKYSSFSKSKKEGEVSSSGGASYGSCPKCDCCQSKVMVNKPSLCYNCHAGSNGHTKYGRPKKGNPDNTGSASHG